MDREAEHGGFDQPRPRGRPSRREWPFLQAHPWRCNVERSSLLPVMLLMFEALLPMLDVKCPVNY